jgi:hypothetical protein
MPTTTLIKLYNDLELLEFELDFLNHSLWYYSSKRLEHWERDFRLYQIEQIKDRIPLVHVYIKGVKEEINIEKYKSKSYSNKNINNYSRKYDEYNYISQYINHEDLLDDYEEYDEIYDE